MIFEKIDSHNVEEIIPSEHGIAWRGFLLPSGKR